MKVQDLKFSKTKYYMIIRVKYYKFNSNNKENMDNSYII